MPSIRTIILFVVFGFALLTLLDLSPGSMHRVSWPDSIQFGRGYSRTTVQFFVVVYVMVASVSPALSYACDKDKPDRKRALKAAGIFLGLLLLTFFYSIPSVQ